MMDSVLKVHSHSQSHSSGSHARAHAHSHSHWYPTPLCCCCSSNGTCQNCTPWSLFSSPLFGLEGTSHAALRTPCRPSPIHPIPFLPQGPRPPLFAHRHPSTTTTISSSSLSHHSRPPTAPFPLFPFSFLLQLAGPPLLGKSNNASSPFANQSINQSVSRQFWSEAIAAVALIRTASASHCLHSPPPPPASPSPSPSATFPFLLVATEKLGYATRAVHPSRSETRLTHIGSLAQWSSYIP